MNDEFITQMHEAPRAEFADALYERISQQPRFAQTLWQRLTLRNSVIMIALLFIVAACVYAVVERGWHKVGGIWVNVQKTHTIEFTLPPETFEESVAQPQDIECLTVEEARQVLRFDIHVPTWAPEGFTLDDRMCGVDQLSDFAYLNWLRAGKSAGISITLSNLRGFNMATQEYQIWPAAVWQPIAPGSYKEVQIQGKPAVLVRGDWGGSWRTGPMTEGKHELKWDKKQALQLFWVDGEVLYSLYTQEDVSVENLIKMAESAR